ncbi:hypothetical protein WJX75_002768 [Coccomyxa subellipsoidea]|uniref:PhyH-domain-containing protein n=1 Tax=Coccomyxa subellipsoidea TaxID=248742 RepID=A0ABR2YJ65_9CHLO
MSVILSGKNVEVQEKECDTILEVARDAASAHTATDWHWVTERGCIFEALPSSVGPLVACSQPEFVKHRSAWPLSRKTCDIIFASSLKNLVVELLGREACIFNDQYIIKPPHAGELSAFPWHQDSNWLRECDVEVQPYLSAWIALDDMMEDMMLTIPAGTLVIMSSTLMHSSLPNISNHLRRAWMPQFSARPIVNCKTGVPLALAVLLINEGS